MIASVLFRVESTSVLYSMLTLSPGATTSGLIRPSAVGPKELKKATVSIFAPSDDVEGKP